MSKKNIFFLIIVEIIYFIPTIILWLCLKKITFLYSYCLFFIFPFLYIFFGEYLNWFIFKNKKNTKLKNLFSFSLLFFLKQVILLIPMLISIFLTKFFIIYYILIFVCCTIVFNICFIIYKNGKEKGYKGKK